MDMVAKSAGVVIVYGCWCRCLVLGLVQRVLVQVTSDDAGRTGDTHGPSPHGARPSSRGHVEGLGEWKGRDPAVEVLPAVEEAGCKFAVGVLCGKPLVLPGPHTQESE